MLMTAFADQVHHAVVSIPANRLELEGIVGLVGVDFLDELSSAARAGPADKTVIANVEVETPELLRSWGAGRVGDIAVSH